MEAAKTDFFWKNARKSAGIIKKFLNRIIINLKRTTQGLMLINVFFFFIVEMLIKEFSGFM